MSLMFLSAIIVSALAQPNPYAPPPRDEAQRLAYRAELGGDSDASAIERWLLRHPKAPAMERAMLAHRLCNNLGVLTGGKRRVAACRLAADLTGDLEDQADLAMAEAFQHEVPIKARGSATVPLTRSAVGLLTVEIAANTARSSWIVDTGAEIAAISGSTAKALNVRFIAGVATIGTATTIRVEGRLGMIDRLTIGSAVIEHLPVLVLPDAMLRLPDGSVIPGILGLPALAAFHKVAWLDGGKQLALGTTESAMNQTSSPGINSPATRIYWHEKGVGVAISTPIGVQGIHLDTGANAGQLGVAGLSLLTPAQRASVIEASARVGGVGGILDVTERCIPELDYKLADSPLHATGMAIGSSANKDGAIGGDMIFKLARLQLDFDTMTIKIGRFGQ